MVRIIFSLIFLLLFLFQFHPTSTVQAHEDTETGKLLREALDQIHKLKKENEELKKKIKELQSKNKVDDVWYLVSRHGEPAKIPDASKHIEILKGISSPDGLIKKLKDQNIKVTSKNVNGFILVEWEGNCLIFGKEKDIKNLEGNENRQRNNNSEAEKEYKH